MSKYTKLNIGSSKPKGEFREGDWLSIDVCKQFGVLQMDGTALGFRDNIFETINAVHVLEHVNRNLREQFIYECHRVLKPGGVCYIEVPDFQEITRMYVQAISDQDETSAHKWLTSIYGKQRYTGDAHNWGYTKTSLAGLFAKVGFSESKVYRSRESLDHMISSHYKQEPVLLAIGTK